MLGEVVDVAEVANEGKQEGSRQRGLKGWDEGMDIDEEKMREMMVGKGLDSVMKNRTSSKRPVNTGRAKRFLRKFQSFWMRDFDPDVSVPPICSQLWFSRHPATDAFVREHFTEDLAHYNNELANEMPGEWAEVLASDIGTAAVLTLSGRMAHIIHAGSAKAWECDEANRLAAFMSVHAGAQMRLGPVRGSLLLMPLIDAESKSSLEAALQNIDHLIYHTKPHQLDYVNSFKKLAEAHYEVLKKFGRYPLRNEVLGRESSPEEQVYIDEAKSVLLQRQ